MHKRETRWIPGNIGAPTKGSRHVHTLAESRGGPRVSHTGTEDPVRPDQSVYPPQCCLEVLAKGKCDQMWRGMYGVPCSTSLHKELVLPQTCLRPASISLLPQASWYPSNIPEQSLKLVSIRLAAQNPASSTSRHSGQDRLKSTYLDPEISHDAGFSSNPTLPPRAQLTPDWAPSLPSHAKSDDERTLHAVSLSLTALLQAYKQYTASTSTPKPQSRRPTRKSIHLYRLSLVPPSVPHQYARLLLSTPPPPLARPSGAACLHSTRIHPITKASTSWPTKLYPNSTWKRSSLDELRDKVIRHGDQVSNRCTGRHLLSSAAALPRRCYRYRNPLQHPRKLAHGPTRSHNAPRCTRRNPSKSECEREIHRGMGRQPAGKLTYRQRQPWSQHAAGQFLFELSGRDGKCHRGRVCVPFSWQHAAKEGLAAAKRELEAKQ